MIQSQTGKARSVGGSVVAHYKVAMVTASGSVAHILLMEQTERLGDIQMDK